MKDSHVLVISFLSALFLLLSPVMFIQTANSTFYGYMDMIPEAFRATVVDTYSVYLNYLYLLFIPGALSLLYLGISRKGSRYLIAIDVILGLVFLLGLPMVMDYYIEQIMAEYGPLLEMLG